MLRCDWDTLFQPYWTASWTLCLVLLSLLQALGSRQWPHQQPLGPHQRLQLSMKSPKLSFQNQPARSLRRWLWQRLPPQRKVLMDESVLTVERGKYFIFSENPQWGREIFQIFQDAEDGSPAAGEIPVCLSVLPVCWCRLWRTRWRWRGWTGPCWTILTTRHHQGRPDQRRTAPRGRSQMAGSNSAENK